MKLELTERYFPKTYAYLIKHETNVSLNTLINKYDLKGLMYKNSKVLIYNQVSDATSDTLLLNTLREFNARLHIDSKHSAIITIAKSNTNSVLVDHDVYDKLIGFVKDYYQIDSALLKYVNVDKLLLNDLKNNHIQEMSLNDKKYIGYDLYIPDNSFYYSNADLWAFELAFHKHDMKVIKSLNIKTRKRIRADSKRYAKLIKPILPILMKDNSAYYRHQMEHGWLLYLVGERLHV